MRREFQVKVEGAMDISLLLSLGAEPLGQVIQQDIYLAGKETWRIRQEAGQYILTQKGYDIGQLARVKEVSERMLSKSEADRLIRERGIRVTVAKTRTLLRLHETVIALDEVEYLGQFVEISSTSEGELLRTLEVLGISRQQVIREGYLDMMIAKALPGWLRLVLRFHDRVGELAFGIASGILTTLGVLTGVNSATSSRLSVIAAIAAIAVADSCSDAFGIYMSKALERGASRGKAFRCALGTLAGKFIFPMMFILPILAFPLSAGVWVNMGWGAIALALLSAEQAVVSQRSIAGSVARNLALATFIVVLSTLVGSLVARLGGGV